MIRQTGLAQAIDIAGNRAKYDECAKKLLSYKAIIAWILKSCTKEFSQYEVQYICDNCLKEEAEVSTHAVHQDELDKDKRLGGDERVEGMNTESNSIQEHTIYYDIRLPAFLPEGNERVRLILNLEIQLDDTPGYPIVKRGFYYCGRMISEQYGTVFVDEHYEKVEKVYSIWICPDPAKKRKNGIFKYHTIEDIIYGEPYTKEENYDLMEVVVLNLGDADKSSDLEILDLLNVLFSATITPEEKKQRLNDEFEIAMTVEFESEVQEMCNLSEALVEQGRAERNISIAQMMIQEREPVEKIERYTGYALEKLKEIANGIGMPLMME
nr:hypothetical protein [uncultured Anaerobutyricum sp.]